MRSHSSWKAGSETLSPSVPNLVCTRVALHFSISSNSEASSTTAILMISAMP